MIQSLDINVDFAGNLCPHTAISSGFDPYGTDYVGEWNKEKVFSQLTKYPNLILLSNGEAHPLVCLEALCPGLGLVLSEFATANLDLSLPFIDVVPESKMTDIGYIKEIVDNKKQVLIKAFDTELNKIIWVPIDDYYMIPNDGDWCGGINDQFAVGSSKDMDIYCDMYNSFSMVKHIPYHPESMLREYLKIKNIESDRFDFKVSISTLRNIN